MYKEHVYLSREANNIYRRGHKYVHIPGCIHKKLLNDLTHQEHVYLSRKLWIGKNDARADLWVKWTNYKKEWVKMSRLSNFFSQVG